MLMNATKIRIFSHALQVSGPRHGSNAGMRHLRVNDVTVVENDIVGPEVVDATRFEGVLLVDFE